MLLQSTIVHSGNTKEKIRLMMRAAQNYRNGQNNIFLTFNFLTYVDHNERQ